MLMLNARCVHCNFESTLELPGTHSDLPECGNFRYLGYNPSSGYIYYQCPGCKIILRVDPLDILGDGFVIHAWNNSEIGGSLRMSSADSPDPLKN